MLRKDGRNGDELVAVTLLFAVTFLAAEASTSTSALKWSIGRHMLFLEHLEHAHTDICVCVRFQSYLTTKTITKMAYNNNNRNNNNEDDIHNSVIVVSKTYFYSLVGFETNKLEG